MSNPRSFLKHIPTIFILGVLTACSGGSGSQATDTDTPTPNSLTGNATLAAGVMVLDAGQQSQVISETPTTVTFNGSISIPPNTVFLTDQGAYQAISSTSTNGQTVVTVQAPPLSSIFNKIQISGKAQVTTDTASIPASISTVPLGVAVGTTLTLPLNFQDGGASGSGSAKTTFKVDAGYDYDSSAGGLKSAHLNVDQATNVSLTLTYKVGAGASTDIPITTFSIPVPITIVDSLLNTVGVKVASINIPTSILFSASSELSASATLQATLNANVTSSYAAGGTPTSSGTITGILTASAPTLDTNGDSVGSTLTGDVSSYLHVRPALAFLNTVALLGVDIQTGPRIDLTAQIVADSPPYCIQGSGYLHGQISGFFKGVGFAGVNTEAFSKDWQAHNFPPVGSCKLETNLMAIVAQSAGIFWQKLPVNVTASPADSQAAGTKIPTGSVSVQMGSQSCVIPMLDVQGNGSCLVTANPAGSDEPIAATYNGDINFNTAVANASANVNRANTDIVVNVDPPQPSIGSETTFDIDVNDPITSPLLDEPSPTGTIDVIGPSGTLCEITLSASGSGGSTGSCGTVFSTPGTFTITTKYEGDESFDSQETSSSLTVAATIGGTVAGLTGTGLVLLDNGVDALPISGDGAFTFATPLAFNTAYNVTIGTQPAGQICTISANGSGIISATNINSVAISCGVNSSYWKATIDPSNNCHSTFDNISGVACSLSIPYPFGLQSGWTFYYNDSPNSSSGSDLIFEMSTGSPVTEIEALYPNLFSAVDASFTIQSYGDEWGQCYNCSSIGDLGKPSLSVTVTSKTAVAMSGTWILSWPLDLSGSGTWSASKVERVMPIPIMNEHEMCQRECFEGSNCAYKVNSGVVPGRPTQTTIESTVGGCIFVQP